MILVFSEVCVVKLVNCPHKIQQYLESEGLIHHSISQNNTEVSIEVHFTEVNEKKILQKLHPNACLTEKGFALHDDKEKQIYPDYNFQEKAMIVSDSDISGSLFWDVLFDHIKLYLLKKNIVTLHAAGLKKDAEAILFFGWDGTGKSSLLTDSLYNGCQYLGDDRIFLSSEGMVAPLFVSIKQFHHELVHYPQLTQKLSFKKRLFINWSQKLDKKQTKINSLLLKLFRKLKLNYEVIPVASLSELENSFSKMGTSFYINKTNAEDTRIELDETLLQRLASNVVYADADLLKRYYTALFSGRINTIDRLDNLYRHVYNILSKTIDTKNIKSININHTTHINCRLWDS
ncbi:MAG: hypothetical protein HRT70_00525 [Flavobacteriaceae bacterium]|nr:hypothetical protein [Flavobacteriaceae bacterium]